MLQSLVALHETCTSLIFHIPSIFPSRWCREHIAVFRSLSNLTALNVVDIESGWSLDELSCLCADPPPQHLQRVSMVVDAEFATYIGRLTGLTELTIERVDTPDASFPQHLAQLRYGRIRCDDLVDLRSLLPAIAYCTRIRTLHFTHADMMEADLCQLVSSLPDLRDLHLTPQPGRPYLAFASVAQLHSTLTSLHTRRTRTDSTVDTSSWTHQPQHNQVEDMERRRAACWSDGLLIPQQFASTRNLCFRLSISGCVNPHLVTHALHTVAHT
jgi:hypothetical protein